MIINLEKRFLFIANLKCASTSIEEALHHDAEICLLGSHFGKHWPLRIVQEHFFWIDGFIPSRDMFVFGVMRSPLDYLQSLYSSHKDRRFLDNPTLYTGGISFEVFLDSWCSENEDQAVPQHTRFLDREGRIGADYVISFEKLEAGLDVVADRLGVPMLRQLPRLNVSSQQAGDVSDTALRRIEQLYADDLAFMERYCDRLLQKPVEWSKARFP